MADQIDQFYDSLQTVPKLIRDLALGVAEAQRALDHDYLLNLAEFTKVIRNVVNPDPKSPIPAAEYISLFKAMAPSRHQFTETTAEVHADLQLASASEFQIGGSFGLKAAIFAVTVNASYTRKNAYNYQAAATIKTLIHAVPADPGVMEKLVARAAASPSQQLPSEQRWRVIADAFKSLLGEVQGKLQLGRIVPEAANEGDKALTATLEGTGFAAGSKVVVSDPDGTEKAAIDPMIESSNRLTAELNADLFKAPKTLKVAVRVGSLTSNALPFEVKRKG